MSSSFVFPHHQKFPGKVCYNNAMENLLGSDFSQLIWIILVLGLAWLALRFILKLTVKLFVAGCSVIVILGIIFFFFGNFLGG